MTLLTINGKDGEGGGQILRTSLSLSALTGRPFRLENIRNGRNKPGLRPQHLTAVQAVARLCRAEIEGAELGSQTLLFRPQMPPQSGVYEFDVKDYAPNGSAGAVTLIWQTLVWPLLFSQGPSHVTLRGGTHVMFSPPFQYLDYVWWPAVARFGVPADSVRLVLDKWGWLPHGGGQITAVIEPSAPQLTAVRFTHQPVETVRGEAVVTNLPAHIPQRMSNRAVNVLRQYKLLTAVQALRLRSENPGAMTFLWTQQAGFTSLGVRGLPSEVVGETAARSLVDYVNTDMAVDPYLADQLLLPMALANGVSYLSTSALTGHALTQVNLLRRWLDVPLYVTGREGQPGTIEVHGLGWRPEAHPLHA
jgi:RNA 3'-terminal phosphate cyclase (ATP)